MFNVLSIDWDYFVQADERARLRHFPDIPSENYSDGLRKMIWTSRYSEDKEIIDIKYNKFVYDVLKAIPYEPYTVVAESHKHIFPFVLKKIKGNTLHLLNIDFHSDYRTDMKELDCGNWMNFFMSMFHGRYEWLGWDDSARIDIPKNLIFISNPSKALHIIRKTKWDMVFICRSDMWSPPHLDDAFTAVFKPFAKNGEVQRGIWESRYNEEMVRNALELRKVRDEVLSKSKKE